MGFEPVMRFKNRGLDYEELAQLVNHEKLTAFRQKAMNPNHPTTSGTNQNPDIHFQQRNDQSALSNIA